MVQGHVSVSSLERFRGRHHHHRRWSDARRRLRYRWVRARQRNLVSRKPHCPRCVGRYLASPGRSVWSAGPGTWASSGRRFAASRAPRASVVPGVIDEFHEGAVRESCRELGRRQCTCRYFHGERHLHVRGWRTACGVEPHVRIASGWFPCGRRTYRKRQDDTGKTDCTGSRDRTGDHQNRQP